MVKKWQAIQWPSIKVLKTFQVCSEEKYKIQALIQYKILSVKSTCRVLYSTLVSKIRQFKRSEHCSTEMVKYGHIHHKMDFWSEYAEQYGVPHRMYKQVQALQATNVYVPVQMLPIWNLFLIPPHEVREDDHTHRWFHCLWDFTQHVKANMLPDWQNSIKEQPSLPRANSDVKAASKVVLLVTYLPVLLFNPEDGSSMFLQTFVELLLDYMALHPRRQYSLRDQMLYIILIKVDSASNKNEYHES
jgi:hypothetical protein